MVAYHIVNWHIIEGICMLTTRMTKNRKIALTIVIVLAMLFSLMTIALNASALVDDNTPPTVTKIEATPSKELAEGKVVCWRICYLLH